ncbi:monofunctional biosynthetic peptidoglycan transglycosylase [Pasteurellaceae bacterium RH1A]|nr:monofunctional biosynthetic peptidoglycan transglycosylase [Pasteurellaceae bacterium RH1A]
MARKRKSSRRRSQTWLGKLVGFFLPKELQGLGQWLWFGFSRISLALGSFFLSLTLIFSLLPIPFSAYMAQQKISHLWQGQPYKIQYQWASLDRIAWQMQMAVIAAEDQNFDNHFGLDLAAIESVLKRKNKKLRGASTLSQQVVKNLYLWHGTSWVRKGIEVPLTLLTETVWSKQRILEIYLNIAEFGPGIFGVEAAAQHYFKKKASQLTMQEAALLAASLPNPHIYKVNRPGTIMRKKQDWIMRQVQNLGGRAYLGRLSG